VEVCESISCPFCGQASEVAIDTSVINQQFTTDCEVLDKAAGEIGF
jgi:hypothetical protein